MKKIFFTLAVLALQGCAGMVIETRGFTPRVTNAIMGVATPAVEAGCSQGVAYQSRQADSRNVYYGGYSYQELPTSRVEATARSVTLCQ